MNTFTLNGHTRAEWERVISAVDATLKSRGIPVPQRIAIVAQGKPTPAPASMAEDLTTVPTEELWRRCSAIKNGPQRTAYFRAHIKPRMRH
jgi:hypothetical protein